VALRLCLYDRTERGRGPLPGLTHAWAAGSALYRGLGRVDRAHGTESWDEGLEWLTTIEPDEPIAEIQFWGHGKWGRAFVNGEPLDLACLGRNHARGEALDRLRARLAPGALFWFRTCETFGAAAGQRFAGAFAERLGCRVAGHTYIIAFWQSGLHLLEAGSEPHWPLAEGLREGSPEEPVRALWSGPRQPCTVSCLAGAVPRGF
jgi:hypothetical protein